MKTFRIGFTFAAIFVFIGSCPKTVFAIEVLKSDSASLSVDGRLQMFGIGQKVSDDAKKDGRLFLFMKQARLSISGSKGDYRFYSEFAFGGEDQVVAPSPGISLGLLDLRFDVPIWDRTFIRVGQFKVPYSAEYLAFDGALLFDERSINSLAFRLGRDVGAAIAWKNDTSSGAVGIFTGGGRDNPERYLPEELGVPLLVLRIGLDSTKGDALSNRQSGVFQVASTETAAYFNAAYMQDSLVGHSTVLNVRSSEKSLLLNSSWNPFLGMTPFSKGTLWQAGVDGAVLTPIGDSVLGAQIELNQSYFGNGFGSLRLYGGRAQVSIASKPIEVALRYAVVFPDERLSYQGVQVTGSQPIQELTPAFTYYLKEWSKIIFETPLLVNTPVAQETGVGAYVLAEQPDQASVIKTKGYVSRQTVPEVRLLWQIEF